MDTRTRLRPLLMTPLAAMMILASPVGSAHAVQNTPKEKTANECLAGGYVYDEAKGCADKACPADKTHPVGVHGQVEWGSVNGMQYCDGFTGRWTEMTREQQPVRRVPGAPGAGVKQG